MIDAQGTVYVGSADHNFYALNPDGTEKWRFQSGEIVDSAGALLPPDPVAGAASVVFPSGDGYLRRLRTDDGTLLWAFDARVAPRASFNNWFEGNVAIGPDGTLYAGNTNFNYYAVHPDGRLKWTYATGANNWSVAAFDADGTIFWGSNDTRVRAVRPDGSEKWTRRTLGFIAASAAVGSDGTVYIGSFDSTFYALDPRSGRVRWKFKTRDHIYGSAALHADGAGRTDAIYFGSTDGLLYALDPAGGLLWSYDTGAPIRSSPVLGRAPEDEGGDILYFGSGNGRLYALDAASGARRWSFDTTPADPELRDRNDLNGSPALGATGVYIGGEHGCVWYVPYDYPLHVDKHVDKIDGATDPRISTDPGEDLPADVAGLFYVSPGGNVCPEPPTRLPAATTLTLRLVVREGGRTVDARVYNAPLGRPRNALQVRFEPPVPFRLEPSADGRYLHVIPDGFLEPGTAYTLHAEGRTYTGGLSVGNLTLGGRRHGRFSSRFTFQVEESAAALPLSVAEDRVSALEWTRLSAPIPTMLPSLNQIGFDYMDWIVGAVEVGAPDADRRGKAVLWAVGARRDETGTLVADPASDFTLPLSGTYHGDAFILTNCRFVMQVTGIPIPFNVFQLRGRLGADLRVLPGATTYADTQVLSIPTFGPLLIMAGLANNWIEKLLVAGTYVTRPYPAHGPANRRPEGITVAGLTYVPPNRRRDGQVTATFNLQPGTQYPLDQHRPAILLINPTRTEAVPLDYHANLSATADPAGNLSTVTLRVPRGTGTRPPEQMDAVVMLDVFPLWKERLATAASP